MNLRSVGQEKGARSPEKYKISICKFHCKDEGVSQCQQWWLKIELEYRIQLPRGVPDPT